MDYIKFFRTARYLRPVQVYRRVWLGLYKPQMDMSPAPTNRAVGSDWQPVAQKLSSLGKDFKFRFLNEEHQVSSAEDWNNPQWEKLWLYNLHYFDDLTSATADQRKDLHEQLIERWIADNSPGQGNGWEPYPLSLRIVNWIKWSLAGNELSDKAVQSLAVQTRYLRQRLEYHLLGNHLFANAKALVFAGLFFLGDEAQSWLDKGLEILAEQIPEQVLDDGGHFELSPMYHSIVLEDLLDLINLLLTYGQLVPEHWGTVVRKMCVWLANMRHPDGEIVLFNDAAFGIAARPDKLFDYAGRLGFEIQSTVSEGLRCLENSGYVRWQSGAATAFLDAAPIGPDYLPGHAHADTLTFELSLWGQRLLVDSGTSCYGEGGERLRQRGTEAHNTVTINAKDSSEVWSGFRVARRARPEAFTVEKWPGGGKVACSHSGYRRLPGKPVHRREWTFGKNSLQIRDMILGAFDEAVGRFYLHPDIKILGGEGDSAGCFVLPGGQTVCWKVTGGVCNVVESTWHPEFGLSVPSRCIEVVFTDNKTEMVCSWE